MKSEPEQGWLKRQVEKAQSGLKEMPSWLAEMMERDARAFAEKKFDRKTTFENRYGNY